MTSLFTTAAQDPESRARTGTLSLPHGIVKTPVFMPVGTNGTVKAISHTALEAMEVRLILANTYHLYLRPGLEVVRRAGGLHAFSGWPANILTDSGGFQVFSLSALRKLTDAGVKFQSHIDGSRHLFTPELVVDAQYTFGSDVAMPLDICTPPGIPARAAREALETTLSWLARSGNRRRVYEDGWDGRLFGIVQGNFYRDLRRESVERTLDLEPPGIAIGGLSVGESFEEFEDLLHYVASLLPPDLPRYVMGIGTPDYLLAAMEAGIDMFDCVFPTRTARNGLVFSNDGPINLRKSEHEYRFEPIDPECDCSACRRYSLAYLRHLFKAKEIYGLMLATEHNLRFLTRLVARAAEAIGEGRFSAYKRETLDRYLGARS